MIVLGALSGVRVVDMTTIVMGPYASQILGDYGADVIKLESPAGDSTRKFPPMRSPDMGHIFLNLNRNKRSLVLDLKKRAALDVFFDLIAQSDIFMYNVRPQAMERLGITTERLAAINPRLISVSMTGFGQDGPYGAQPAYDDLIQGLTAVPNLLMRAGVEKPQYVPMAFNDRAVGLYALSAILAALYARERTGKGQKIEIPMFEVMAHATLTEHLGGLTFEPANGPAGYQRSLTKERRPFPTQDGYICALIYSDAHWQAFCKIVGHDFDSDPRLTDISKRTMHIGELYMWVSEYLAKNTSAYWLEKLSAADIPVAPLHTLESLFQDPHLRAVNFFQAYNHPTEGNIIQMRPPGAWSETPPSIRRPAPRLGEHSVEILREIGYGDQKINALIDDAVTRS